MVTTAKVVKSSKRHSYARKASGRGSKPGERRGPGRKGIPNKATSALREEMAKFLGKHGLDRPVIELMKVGYGLVKWPVVVTTHTKEGPEYSVEEVPASPELRVTCLKEAAQYDGAKLAAIQVVDDEGNVLPVPAMIAAETYVKAIERAMTQSGGKEG